MKTKELFKQKEQKQKIELTDAHCHLDLLEESQIKASIAHGINLIITNGTDTKSNMKNLDICDNKHIFAALGIDPEHALTITDEELDFNINIIRNNRKRITAIGEIGLDYLKAKDTKAINRQKQVFERFLDLSIELDLPVSIHARNAIDDVLKIITKKDIKRAQLHFFEGDLEQAQQATKHGYMVSVPPMRSSRRDAVVKQIDLHYLLAESDSPAAGKTPLDIDQTIAHIASVRQMAFDEVAAITTANFKRFFNISNNIGLRS